MALKSELMASSLPAAAAKKLGFDTPATVTAAGSGQSSATVLTGNYANVTAGTGGVLIGDEKLLVMVNTSGSTITVYPPVGQTINNQAANAGLAVGTGKQALFIQAGTGWVGIVSA